MRHAAITGCGKAPNRSSAWLPTKAACSGVAARARRVVAAFSPALGRRDEDAAFVLLGLVFIRDDGEAEHPR